MLPMFGFTEAKSGAFLGSFSGKTPDIDHGFLQGLRSPFCSSVGNSPFASTPSLAKAKNSNLKKCGNSKNIFQH